MFKKSPLLVKNTTERLANISLVLNFRIVRLRNLSFIKSFIKGLRDLSFIKSQGGAGGIYRGGVTSKILVY